MERRLFLALPILALLPAALPAAADTVNSRGGLAAGGYDAVAYFAEGRARRGAAVHFHDWQGARWLFVSSANRDAFAAAPDRYAPRYGGYCAYGMAHGYKAPVDPEAWTVEGGRLYLNYSRSVRRTWLEDVPGYVARAEANWPTVSAQR
jgi:hypothetical protein